MPDAAEIGLFLHIVGVFGAAGAVTAFVFAASMMRRVNTAGELRVWAGFAAMIENLYLFPISALLIFGSGAYLVSKHDHDWGEGWISASMLALIVVAALDLAVDLRKANAIKRSAQDAPEGPLPQVLSAQVTDPVLFGSAHTILLVLLAVIWNMTTEPATLQAYFTIIVAAVIGVGSAAPMVIRQQRVLERRAERGSGAARSDGE